ncbi:hypothetical protein BGX27_005696 [Mortierella sp. AM989]|nr:hypothetical protein BGX27_005696 [Mortierella sp. AM989]
MTESTSVNSEEISHTLPPYSSQLDDIQQTLENIQLSLSPSTLSSTQPAIVSSNTEQVQTSYLGMVRKDYVLAKLDILQDALAAIASSLPPLTSLPEDILPQTPAPSAVGKEGVNAKFETIEQMIAGIANALSPSYSAKAPMQYVIEPEQAEPSLTAPRLEKVRYRIILLKNILFDLEKNPPKAREKPGPPSGPALDDEELFMTWCESAGLVEYKQKIFTLIEKLLREEDAEEKKSDGRRYSVRGNVRVSETFSSDERRKRLQAKMEKLKQSAIMYHSQKTPNSSRPNLLAHPSMMDIDEFMIWCLRSSDFNGFKKLDGLAHCWPNVRSYEHELGLLIQAQKAKIR